MNDNLNRTNGNNSNASNDDSSLSLIDLLDNLFYFRWYFIFTLFFVSGLALLYAILATPIFVADALIQVEDKKGSSLGALTQVATALGAQQSPVLGEIEIVRSRSVVGKAVDQLHANIEVSVENRIPVLGNWLSRVLPRASDGLVKPFWDNSRFAWGGERITINELTVPESFLGKPLHISVVADGKWQLSLKEGDIIAEGASNGQLVTALEGALRVEVAGIKGKVGTRFRIIVYSIPSRVGQVLGALAVTEAKRQSNILRLTFESSNPTFAASMLNAISDAYIRQNIERRSEEAELSLRFLNEELPKLRIQLDKSEKALNDFRSKSKTLDISTEIKELLAKTTAIEKLQLELQLKKSEYSERYDAAHPLMKALDAQINGIKSDSAGLNQQIAKLPSIEQDYIRLARDVQVNNQLYVGLLNNAQQLQIAKAGTIGNVSIVDRAVIPEGASRPKKPLIVAAGCLIGVVLGFLICQMLAFVSQIVRDPRKLEFATNLPTLGILPLDEDQVEQNISRTKTFLLAKEKPSSSSIEALRSLRTSLLFKLSEKVRSKVVLVTSAVPAQGKSFIAVNLSYLLAATDRRVILVEADIRLASSRRYIDYPEDAPGLSTVLKNDLDINLAIRKDVFLNMDFLPSGPAIRNPGDLLATDKMKDVIDLLADQYDFVIIDSPPLLPVHDARALGKYSDLTLFVVRQDEVNLSEVFDAVDVFNKSGNTIDGIVFNGFIPSRMRYGYGYGYGYGYRNYGKRSYGKRYGAYTKYGRDGRYGGYGDHS